MKPSQFFFFIFFAARLFAATTEYELVKEKSTLDFVSKTKRFDVRGVFSDWKVGATSLGPKLTDVKVSLSINMANFDTGNTDRDKHLRTEDFFWVEKYPVATFESKKVTHKDDGKYHIEGELTLRGVKKAIEFDAKLEEKIGNKDGNFRITGEVNLNRKDFGMTYQRSPFLFFIPKITDNVVVHFDLFAIAKAPPLEKKK